MKKGNWSTRMILKPRMLIVICGALAALLALLLLVGGDNNAGDNDRAKTTATTTQPVIEDEQQTAASKVALAYALAARTWTPDTFREQYSIRVKLATGRLRRDLQRFAPTDDEIAQLRIDGASAGANLVRVTRRKESKTDAEYIVVLDERNIAAGQDIRARTTNVVTLRHRSGNWRVTGFTIRP